MAPGRYEGLCSADVRLLTFWSPARQLFAVGDRYEAQAFVTYANLVCMTFPATGAAFYRSGADRLTDGHRPLTPIRAVFGESVVEHPDVSNLGVFIQSLDHRLHQFEGNAR